ncbi:MAG: hypothetical protein M2R45_01599 [Verrucomicrobia subdivision 3 bacterium]|nr:hypothetical protein [Limisphaerales bacterium]MCS1412751.1 hypothetical protein [Limisphaerales bacterium]
MQPVDIQVIGNALAIKWDNQSESFIPVETLRHRCPCASCQGEKDIMGNVYKDSPKPLEPNAFEIKQLAKVGGYAIRPVWGDGHATGLFSFDYLIKLAESDDEVEKSR